MEHLLVALAVWAIWETLIDRWLEVSGWMAALWPFAAGVGGQALIDYDKLWLGLGIGGLAVAIGRLADLLLVTSDWARVSVLRQQRRSP